MLIDISMEMDLKDLVLLPDYEKDLVSLMKNGHLGTHIDVKGDNFNLSNCIRNGRIFDATHVKNGEVEPGDLYGIDKISKNDFVIIHTGWSEKEVYGTQKYFNEHPEISMDLLGFFISKGVSLIGIDAPGLKRGDLHSKIDGYLADHGILAVENLCNLESIEGEVFQVYCFPINVKNVSGLPCRVLVEIKPLAMQ